MNLIFAALLAAAPAYAESRAAAAIEEGKKAAEAAKADAVRQAAARQAEMEAYWAAQPEAEPVVPGQLLQKLRAIPWPDPRPVPKDKYFERPEVKARELSEEESDPLLAGVGKREAGVKLELEAAQDASDKSRYDLWMENYGFYTRALNDCESGRTAGAARVKIVEGLLAFLKEGTPRFYLKETSEQAAGALGGLGERAALLAADLYKKGQYVPDAPSLLWAERLGGRMAGGMGVTGAERNAYFKIIARVRAFDPRAPQAEGAGGGVKAAAPAAVRRDEKWEKFLAGLVGRCNAAISSMNFSDMRADYKKASLQEGAAIKEILSSFPPGWEDYPRAAWAHGWFSGAVERALKDPSDAGRATELFKALDNYEAGLKAGN